jgi:hypothetical protein
LLAIMPIERQGDWLRACFLCGGGRDLQVLQVATTHDAAAALRQQSFDLLVLWHEGLGQGVIERWHQLAQLGGDAGFVALGMHVSEGWQEPLFAAGALACLDMDQTDPVTLVHTLRTSAELERLRRESHIWETDRARLREREARDIDRVLAGQRSLLERLDQFGGAPSGLSEEDGAAAVSLNSGAPGMLSPGMTASSARELPTADALAAELGAFYLQSLQSFIFEETQSSAEAIAELAQRFIEQHATSSTIMRVHLAAVTQITSKGGTGSMRHCLTGADRFLMELLMRLVDRHILDRHSVDRFAADGQPERTHADRTAAQRHAAPDAQGRKGRLHTAPSPLAAA